MTSEKGKEKRLKVVGASGRSKWHPRPMKYYWHVRNLKVRRKSRRNQNFPGKTRSKNPLDRLVATVKKGKRTSGSLNGVYIRQFIDKDSEDERYEEPIRGDDDDDVGGEGDLEDKNDDYGLDVATIRLKAMNIRLRMYVRYAEMAVRCWNKQNKGSDELELVEVVSGNKFVTSGVWLHFNFNAKSKCADKCSTLRLFFAEFRHSWNRKITTCREVKKAFKNYCSMCHPTWKVCHPQGVRLRGSCTYLIGALCEEDALGYVASNHTSIFRFIC